MLQQLISGSLVLILSAAAVHAHAEGIGRIKAASGTVHIERGGERVPARIGTAIQSADTVVTGKDGAVGITFTDNTRLSTGPDSVLVIERYVFDQTTHAGAFDTSLRRGTLAAVSGRLAKHAPEAVTVRTPTMVLGLRGTEFLVYAE